MLVDFADLQRFSHRKRTADVIRWLNERGINWMADADGKPCTTITQIDKALGSEESEGFVFDGQEAS